LIAYVKQTATQFRTGRGRHTHWTEKHRQDQIDFALFETVSVHHLKHGLTWGEAYVEAANSLGASQVGPPRTIEASYKRVARALRNGEWGRYYQSKRIKIQGMKGP
jgi:hypothetical protein